MHLGSVGVSRNGGRTAKGWNIAICMLLARVLLVVMMFWVLLLREVERRLLSVYQLWIG